MNHTRFPKEDHLPYWASGQQSYEGWSCRTRYPVYRRLGGPQGRSGRAENLVPTGIRSPDRPARSSVAIPTELPDPQFRDALSWKYKRLNLMYLFFVSDLKETSILWTDFKKIHQYQISLKSVHWELSCFTRTDGQTNRHAEANGSFS